MHEKYITRMLYQKKVYLLLLTIIPLDPSVRLASKWSLSKSVYTHFISDRWKRIKFISLEVKISTNIRLPFLKLHSVKWKSKEICIIVLYFTSIECEEQRSIKFIKKSACSRTYKNRRIFETQLNETCFTKRK
jgi:hypothetical protein